MRTNPQSIALFSGVYFTPYPEQLAKSQGVIVANTQPYTDAYNIQDPDGANALNYDTSWDVGMAIMHDVTQNNGANFKLTEIRGTEGVRN